MERTIDPSEYAVFGLIDPKIAQRKGILLHSFESRIPLYQYRVFYLYLHPYQDRAEWRGRA